jgi:hypothetical protein
MSTHKSSLTYLLNIAKENRRKVRTGTAVDLFYAFDAPYIDVRGDGIIGMCQERAILPDSVDLVQAQNCQVNLTHAQGQSCLGTPPRMKTTFSEESLMRMERTTSYEKVGFFKGRNWQLVDPTRLGI